MSGTIIYEQHDTVALVSLNRPDSLNGFTREMCDELVEVLEKAHNDSSIRAVVLTGEGRAFSAGADLKKGFDNERTLHGTLQYEYRPVLHEIAEIPKPVIAAVPGFAAGIGISFVLHSDLVVMAEDAFLLSPFTTISLLPDGGANWLLVRQLGYHRAYQLSIESERISAERCVELGLANKTAPAGEVRDVAIEWGKQLSKRAPLSLAATKKAMRFAMENTWASSYDLEAELQCSLGKSDDAKEGVAAFFDKRDPEFSGR